MPYFNEVYDCCGDLDPDASSWLTSKTKMNDTEGKSTWTGGVGVGYDFGWIRTDATLNYTYPSKVTGTRSGSGKSGYMCELEGTCRSEEQGKVSAWTLMANGYVDIGKFYGLTPYVGAGIGAAHVNWDKWSSKETCRGQMDGCTPDYPDFLNGETSAKRSWEQKGREDWALAWALMAGASYKLTENLDLDLGYRYLKIEDGDAVQKFRNGDGKEIGKIDYKDLINHEFHAGLRYTLPNDILD